MVDVSVVYRVAGAAFDSSSSGLPRAAILQAVYESQALDWYRRLCLRP